MNRRWSIAIAILVASASALLFIASMFLKVGYVSSLAGDVAAVVTPLAFMLFSVVGALIVVRRGNHPIAWLFLLAGAGWAVMWFSGVVVERAKSLGSSPPDPVIWLSAWTELFGITATILTLFLFPTGRVVSPRWRVWLYVTIGGGLIAIVGEMLAPGRLEDYPHLTNPYAAGELFNVFRAIGWPLLVSPIAASVVALTKRSRRARGEERQQLKWMLLAGGVLAGFIVFWAVSAGVFGSDRIAEALQGVALGTMPAAAGVAILKYRLYDIDVVINRTLVYATLTAVLAGLYVGLVFLFQSLLEPITAESDLSIAGSTLAVAALFRPLRRRVQGFIDHRFYRRKVDAQRTVDEFSAHLRDEVDLRAVSEQLVGVVRDTMQPRHVSVWMRVEAER